MLSDLEFLIVLLEQEKDTCIAVEDFDGPCGAALRRWQETGFVGLEPGLNPVMACPYCDEGSVYFLEGRYRCDSCYSNVDRRHLLLWPFKREAFFRWLSGQLGLNGISRQIDGSLWQLGTLSAGPHAVECFYRFDRPLGPEGKARLDAYRDLLLVYGVTPPREAERRQTASVSLLSLLHQGTQLTVTAARLRSRSGSVRFDAVSGVLSVADMPAGAVRTGTKEAAFLACLADRPDQVVSFREIKRFVQRETGSRDATDEATLCHKLKSGIKRKIPSIDRLVVTGHKGEGYLLRGEAELP